MSTTGITHRKLFNNGRTHELPVWPGVRESRRSPECPESAMSPVSEGQAVEQELKGLATANACTCAEDEAETKRFKLARDLRGLEEKIDRKLTTAEFKLTCDEWERLSLHF